MVKYLKENFFVRYRIHVNQQLEQWMADVANCQRRVKSGYPQLGWSPLRNFAISSLTVV